MCWFKILFLFQSKPITILINSYKIMLTRNIEWFDYFCVLRKIFLDGFDVNDILNDFASINARMSNFL